MTNLEGNGPWGAENVLGYFPRIFSPRLVVDPKLWSGRPLDQVFKEGTVPVGWAGAEGEVQNPHVFLQLIFMTA